MVESKCVRLRCGLFVNNTSIVGMSGELVRGVGVVKSVFDSNLSEMYSDTKKKFWVIFWEGGGGFFHQLG